MPKTIQYHSFFAHTCAETEEAASAAWQFKQLMRQQGEVMERMNNEIAMHRRQSEMYCRAMEARNKELAEQDDAIESLTNRARKEARNKYIWMAAACLTWTAIVVWVTWLR